MTTNKVPVAAIMAATGSAAGVSVEELRGPSRAKSLVLARHAAIYIAFTAKHSKASIGRAFARDHSTIGYAVSRVSAELPAYRSMLTQINAKLVEYLDVEDD